ncbi:MAG: hypothetical protein J2P29_12555 [Actinobacteria bacterium]|nr:hypothetical protein [Actinomycetota bacterium]
MASDGGEIRAIFKGAQEDIAQAIEDTGNKIGGFIDQTARNAEDSIRAVEAADGASADAARGIHGEDPAPEAGSAAGGQNPVSRMINAQEEPRLKPGTPEYERYIEELATDPAKGNRIKPSSRREAVVGAQAEADGDLPGPLTRAPFDENGKDAGEFIDSTGQHWDVKSSPDITPDYTKRPGMPIPHPQTDAKVTDMINEQLNDNINVLLDPHGMSPARLAHIKELVASHPEWRGKVVWGK